MARRRWGVRGWVRITAADLAGVLGDSMEIRGKQLQAYAYRVYREVAG